MTEYIITAGALIAGITCCFVVRRFACARLRRTKHYYSALLDDGSDLIAILDREGVRRFVSSSYERVLGYHPNDVVGKSVLDFVHPEDLPEARAQLSSDRTFGTKRDLKIRVQHADGSWRWLSVNARNRLNDPAVRGFVMTARDETRLRELESNLLQAQKLEIVGRLANSVAHDFRNLLTIVIGNLGLVHDKRLSADDRDAISEARDAAERASTLSRQLMLFSRGKLLEPRRMNLNDLVSGMERLIVRLVGSSVQVTFDLEPALWDVIASPPQVEQAILNLVVNARDAMTDTGSLSMTTKNVTVRNELLFATGNIPSGNYACVEVCDTGGGIAPEVVTRIFDPFFTTKNENDSMGIGLATVAGIMHKSDGFVAVQTKVGEGSKFVLYFPAAA